MRWGCPPRCFGGPGGDPGKRSPGEQNICVLCVCKAIVLLFALIFLITYFLCSVLSRFMMGLDFVRDGHP